MTAEVVSMVMNNAAASALVLVVLVSSAAAAAAAMAEGCRDDLIAFSGCLAYVSYPPNNLTESPSEKCCMAFSKAVESDCLCYVVGDPLILGFPLNTTRLFSLSSLCPSPFSTSFPSLCSSNSSALPPLATASNQTLGTSVRAGGRGGGRGGGGGGGGGGGRRGGGRGKSGSGDEGESSGRSSPVLNGGAGTVSHSHSSSSTLIPFFTFSVFLAIFSTLHNT